MVRDARRSFLVAIGKAAQAKHGFQVGDEVSGEADTAANAKTEVAEFYKTAKLKVVSRSEEAMAGSSGPPFLGIPPELEVYRARGHRRLAAKTYDAKCTTCIWGCRMPVVMTIDQWNPRLKQYRFETFCYGPKSCRSYAAGPKRRVPGRKGMTYTEEDWVDEEATGHRGPDD
jgi:hypothetical protein